MEMRDENINQKDANNNENLNAFMKLFIKLKYYRKVASQKSWAIKM